jgi:glutathione S-transferase
LPAPQPVIFARKGLTMTITITAFERSPDGGKGLARDTRVPWARRNVRNRMDRTLDAEL